MSADKSVKASLVCRECGEFVSNKRSKYWQRRPLHVKTPPDKHWPEVLTLDEFRDLLELNQELGNHIAGPKWWEIAERLCVNGLLSDKAQNAITASSDNERAATDLIVWGHFDHDDPLYKKDTESQIIGVFGRLAIGERFV